MRRCDHQPQAPLIGGSARVLIVGLAVMLLFGACSRGRINLSTPPDWVNSAITARERVNVTPAMSMAERLAELRRAKEAAYQQLVAAVYALPLTPEQTIEASVTKRPDLQPQVESYVRRAAVLESIWQQQQMEIRATVEVGAELLELLQVKQAPASDDRNTPSTGIVRPY